MILKNILVTLVIALAVVGLTGAASASMYDDFNAAYDLNFGSDAQTSIFYSSPPETISEYYSGTHICDFSAPGITTHTDVTLYEFPRSSLDPYTSTSTMSPTASTSTMSPTASTSTMSPTASTSTMSPSTIDPYTSTSTMSPTASTSTMSPTASTSTMSPTASTSTMSPTASTSTMSPTASTSTMSPSTIDPYTSTSTSSPGIFEYGSGNSLQP